MCLLRYIERRIKAEKFLNIIEVPDFIRQRLLLISPQTRKIKNLALISIHYTYCSVFKIKNILYCLYCFCTLYSYCTYLKYSKSEAHANSGEGEAI